MSKTWIITVDTNGQCHYFLNTDNIEKIIEARNGCSTLPNERVLIPFFNGTEKEVQNKILYLEEDTINMCPYGYYCGNIDCMNIDSCDSECQHF